MSFRRLSAALNNFNRIRTECQRPERASIHTLHLIEFDLSTLIHFHSHWSLSQPRFRFYGGPTALYNRGYQMLSFNFPKFNDKLRPDADITEIQAITRSPRDGTKACPYPFLKPFTTRTITIRRSISLTS